MSSLDQTSNSPSSMTVTWCSPPTGRSLMSPRIGTWTRLLGTMLMMSRRTLVAGGMGVPLFTTPKAPFRMG
eukprot:7378575-Pyramimonas_sp.AAC.1